ncbi:MAG: hypothetical protein ACERKV_11470 [Clostridiaceae bacterium]
MNKISEKERLIVLIIFSLAILIYGFLGVYESNINPIIKSIPALAIIIYTIVREILIKIKK